MTPADIRKLADVSDRNSERGYEDDANASVLRALADVVDAAQFARERAMMTEGVMQRLNDSLAKLEALRP